MSRIQFTFVELTPLSSLDKDPCRPFTWLLLGLASVKGMILLHFDNELALLMSRILFTFVELTRLSHLDKDLCRLLTWLLIGLASGKGMILLHFNNELALHN